MDRQVDMDLPDTGLLVGTGLREDMDLPVDTAAATVAQVTQLDTLSVIVLPTVAAVDTVALADMVVLAVTAAAAVMLAPSVT